MPISEELGTYTPDNLIAGHKMPIVTDSVTVISGQKLIRGTVVGLITASGKAKKLDSASSDGSEKFYGILAEDVDATLADSVGAVYLTGEFNQSALVLGGTTTAASVKAAARYAGVFFRTAKA